LPFVRALACQCSVQNRKVKLTQLTNTLTLKRPMNNLLQTAYHDVLKGAILSEEQMRGVVNELMEGLSDPYQTAGFLSVLVSRGESVSEIAGAARVMRDKCTPIRESGAGLLDTCGTGGDGLHTFNISTAAAILCASAGMSVAKHGNRSVSSTSGSADVLEQLGVAITLTPGQVDQCIEKVQIGFCFAPLLHQAMKHVVPIRKALKTRTIFNMLGPLTNPARAEFQLVGTIRNEWAKKMAEALCLLGTERTAVVCGNNELDEVCLWGITTVYLVENNQLTEFVWTPEDFGLPTCRVEEIQVHSAKESAEMIRGIFAGQAGPARNIAVANAAAALWTSRKVNSLVEGAEQIQNSIDSGQAQQKLEELSEFTQSFV